MRVSREHVAENRRAILEAASRLFRERGYESVTVAEVMKVAGSLMAASMDISLPRRS